MASLDQNSRQPGQARAVKIGRSREGISQVSGGFRVVKEHQRGGVQVNHQLGPAFEEAGKQAHGSVVRLCQERQAGG